MKNKPDSTPVPVRISAALGRRIPTAWARFDEARAARHDKTRNESTWLTYDEAFSALRQMLVDRGLDALPPETVADLYAFGTWRVTQGIYRFDPDLLSALAETPLDISLPASLLTRLPEWAVFVETAGFTHFGKSIIGMIATLFQAPSGMSLMLTLIPESVTSLDDDLDRWQLHLSEMPLRERLRRDISDQGFRRDDFADAFVALAKTDAGEAIEPPPVDDLTESQRLGSLDAMLAEIVPFISLLMYLCSEEPDMPERTTPPAGTSTKRGVRFFPPARPRVWPVGVRMGAALRDARLAHATAESGGRGAVRPHFRKAHWHSFWTGPRDGDRKLRVRWLMPVAVNVAKDEPLPAMIRRVRE